jgi:hypothetical protein
MDLLESAYVKTGIRQYFVIPILIYIFFFVKIIEKKNDYELSL